MSTTNPDVLTTPVVARLSSLYVLTDEPGALCERISTVLQLPTSHPLSDHGAFSAAAVSLGTCDLSIQRWSWLERQPTPPLRIGGLLFTPAQPIDAAGAELDLRSIPRTPSLQMTIPSSDGSAPYRQTSIDVHGIVGDGIEVVLLEREGGDSKLAAGSIVTAREVVLTTPTIEAARRAWDRLLAPMTRQDDRWMFGNGPTLRVVAGAADHVSLVLTVPSLADAERRLRTCGVTSSRRDGSVLVDPAALYGIDVHLVGEE